MHYVAKESWKLGCEEKSVSVKITAVLKFIAVALKNGWNVMILVKMKKVLWNM